MLSLAKATKEIRFIIKFGGIFIGALFAIFIIYNLGFAIRNAFFPSPSIPPEEKFGKLPKLNFPTDQNYQINYKVNTITGVLPSFPDRVKVYAIQQQDPNLLNLISVREKLNTIGFNKNETKLSETLYQWTSNSIPERTIKYDIISQNFDITFDLSNYQNISKQNLPQEDKIQDFVFQFVNGIQNDLSDIDTNYYIEYYNLSNENLLRTNFIKEAQIAKVSLYQKSIDDLEIYYPYQNESTMQLLIGSGKSSNLYEGSLQILQSHFKHQKVDLSNSSTYPIKSSNQAYEDLKKGKAFIFNPDNQQNIDILDVILGYYLQEENQEYLVPVIVFTGKNFKAYVEAIPDSSIAQ